MNLADLPHAAHHALQRALSAVPLGARHHCCLCGRRVRRFLPYRLAGAGLPPVLREQDVIGSDTDNFECPACGCHDRERHLFLYLRATGLLGRLRGARVLHFAPEHHLQRVISAAEPAEYVRADLHPTRPDVRRTDLTAIDFEAGRFDVVIANHVLEHVDDDTAALTEILRVLRPGGHAILQTPFSSRLPAKYEDARITGQAERLRAYGQEDHCRLYGADLAASIAACGFVDKTGSHADLLPGVDAVTHGVNAREPLLLFAKPGSA